MTALLSPAAVIAGLAALAGALWLLQRLRVRHRPVRVVSTLFWRQALEEARARVFVERFRHPLAYLLLLAIGTLIWLAAAGLDLDRRAGEHHLVILDASARMAAPDRFAATVALVEETVARLPRARRRVILAGGETRTLLLPGEPERLLGLRLAARAPEAAPATVDRALADQLPALAEAERATVWVAGDSPLSPGLLAALPTGVTVVPLVAPRAADDAADDTANRGILALGVAPAESGDWERVDLLVEVAGEGEISAAIDGSPVAAEAERSAGAGRARFLFRDLPARGGRFEAALAGGDGNPLDDRAARALPVRRALRVALSPSLAPWLEPALRADPAVRLVEDGAEIAVRRAGETTGGVIPALEFVPRDLQEESILLTHEGSDSAAALARALLELGLDEVDAMELAERAGRPITIGARPADAAAAGADAGGTAAGRGIGVWEDLLAEDYNFVASRSFPLFVALALRWILDIRDFPAEVAAGRPLPGAGRLAAGGLALDPIGVSVRPPRAGEYADERDLGVSVALLDAGTTSPGAALPADAPSPSGATPPLATILGLAAFALLAVEWFLLRTGRIP